MWQLLYIIGIGACLSAYADTSDELFLRAQQEQNEGDTQEALTLYKKALELDPNHFNSLVALAKITYESQQTDDAITYYKKAYNLKSNDPHLCYNIGQSYSQKEAWADALAYYKQALVLDRTHVQSWVHKGAMEEKLGNYQDAIATYKKMAENNINTFEAYHRLGNAYKHIEDLENALEAYRKAYELQPKNIHIMMELANTLNMLDQCPQALTIYKKMIDINRGIISALYNYGYTLKKMGKIDEALAVYEEILQKKSDYTPVLFSRSTIFLAKGDYERGFKEYEWRWKAYDEQPKKYNRPLWEGEDLTGKILVVNAEQGLGDTLQFVRYLKFIKEHFNKHITLVFETQDPLYDLLKIQNYIDETMPRSQKPKQCHYHIPLMSLARVLKTRIDTIPSDFPYIEPDPELVAYWKKELDKNPNIKIGICWQGNSGYSTLSLRKAVESKSVPLKLFAPLCDIPNVTVYSLQQVNGVDQIAECGFADKLVQFDNTFDKDHGRFMDTAAVIKNLDVVISVDTAICHLAGALNVPTWILLPNPPDWRWLINRTDSVWYPTARLFQQPIFGDWPSTINNVVSAAQQLVLEKKYPHKKQLITQELLKTDIELKKEFSNEQLMTSLD